jgi:hypothetical protein
VVGVWDIDGVRRAGHLPYQTAGMVAAAVEQGLAVEALVLGETRVRLDDRRAGLRLFVHAPALVRVEPSPDEGRMVMPRLPRSRERVVLVAEGSELRWWDPSGRGGPLELDALRLSAPLAADLRHVSAAYARVTGDDPPDDQTDGLEHDLYRASLEARLRTLWQRARAELGRRYAVGLLGPGMATPAWSPSEAVEDDEDDVAL